MEKLVVKKINNLLTINIQSLLIQSKKEGFRFVKRLVNDLKTGENTYKQPGEVLFGVFNSEGSLVAIGGINIDPFSNIPYIGRLSRFYVSKEYRRKGLGRLLLKKIIAEASNDFNILVLHTDTKLANFFYTCTGFSKGNLYPKSTLYMELQ
ncbi:hypothetical protein WQ54_16995 [Bacillus sp. SA1-12]|uniref:GNAT family N-acetyltransferase n=1 Tax=Bacillus sp. SA1-12 TaxID=1455638 RepID=UPI0006272DF4|nr:GNAT family N-acetyltransferase [Bacillus sp. SA1-12]KKI91050.1 hypothetical protein WQ54_16995 [Bacillus sp. SA1-12]